MRELVPGSEIEIADELSEDDCLEVLCRGVISMDNACDHLGWELRYHSLHQGIGEFVDSYRAFLAANEGER